MKTAWIKTIGWLVFAMIASIAVQTPMLWHGEYHFLLPNLLIVFVTITSIRNSFEFYIIGLHKNKWVRYALFVFNIFLFIYILNRLELILGVIDSMAMDQLITSDSISLNEAVDLMKYINTEFLLFSVSSFVGIIIYNIRILSSFWKKATIKRERKLL